MMRRTIALMTLAILMLGALPLLAHDQVRIVGTISKRSQSSLDVKTRDAKTMTVALDEATTVSRDKKKVDVSELKVGLTVVVDALGDDEEHLVAIEVRLVPPIAPRRVR